MTPRIGRRGFVGGAAALSAGLWTLPGRASSTMDFDEARHLLSRTSFGATPALRGASLRARRGEILAIMGPSGSGKSTLLHCLAGILTPDSGEIWFAGQRVDSLGEAQRSRLRRDRFGFVFQFGQLVPELTAAENVALPLLAANFGDHPPLRIIEVPVGEAVTA